MGADSGVHTGAVRAGANPGSVSSAPRPAPGPRANGGMEWEGRGGWQHRAMIERPAPVGYKFNESPTVGRVTSCHAFFRVELDSSRLGELAWSCANHGRCRPAAEG